MIVEPFRIGDIQSFMELATAENWVAGEWEFEFLLTVFPQGCLVVRDGGTAVGFVTSLLHERSGWIGNLVVAAPFRGRGIGQALFRQSTAVLRKAGARTVWLTASEAGMPLYEKHGFKALDLINRWVGSGRQRRGAEEVFTGSYGLAAPAHKLDAAGWGDRRQELLDVVAQRGRVVQDGAGFVVLQPVGDAVQLGPFAAVDAAGAARLFAAALATVPRGIKVLVDVAAANRVAGRLFGRAGMSVAGSNVLMYAGRRPDYRPDLVYGLATMGSCG
jgi:ribosomal protein S18 acetylase RimI-like enzyme